VCQADSPVGSARECATGNQRCRGYGRLNGHPGAETQTEPGQPGRQVLVAWMDKDQGAEFVRDGEEPVQARVGEFDIADSGTNLDTEESTTAHASPQLFNGAVGVLQGDGAQRGEARWVLAHDSGEELVLSRRQFGRACRGSAVAECHRNRRKHLHRNVVTIHINEPGIRRPAPVIDPAVGHSTEHELRFGLARPVDTGPAIMRVSLLQIRQILADGVGMDIDESGAGESVSVDGPGSGQLV
jgi:hypothetical protein